MDESILPVVVFCLPVNFYGVCLVVKTVHILSWTESQLFCGTMLACWCSVLFIVVSVELSRTALFFPFFFNR